MNYIEKRNEAILKLFPTPLSGDSLIPFETEHSESDNGKQKLKTGAIRRLSDQQNYGPTLDRHTVGQKLKSHYLQEINEYTGNRRQRKACRNCYKKLKTKEGREIARNKSRKVSTFCKKCPEKPFLCSDCFEEYHSNTVRPMKIR
jgi:hypothetical protein